MNRSAKRLPLFREAGAYRQFLQVLTEALVRRPVRLLAFCVMPTHWHLVLWPYRQTDLSRFGQWLTLTHALRWHRFNGSQGGGAVYQSRYKAIPVQGDHHFYTVVRYVERNPVRAGLVSQAEEWEWGSASPLQQAGPIRLSPWPVDRPPEWRDIVNGVEPADELRRLRELVARSLPVGDQDWSRRFMVQPATRQPDDDNPR
jgi:putative transposase